MVRLFTFVVLIVLLLSPKGIFAQEDFNVSAKSIYEVSAEGAMRVVHEIEIENAFTNVYAKEYVLRLSGVSARDVRAYDDKQELGASVSEKDGNIEIKISFDDELVGKGKLRKFFVSHSERDLVKRTGDVWEIFVPKVENSDYDSYSVELVVPHVFGKEAFVSPQPVKKSVGSTRTSYFFSKEAVAPSGVTAAFGDFQVYNFVLNYKIKNDGLGEVEQSIALPPDTAYQKVILDNVQPPPERVNIDTDGNWMAIYKMKSREEKSIVAQGFVQVFAVPRPFLLPSAEVLQRNLLPTEHWQANNPNIMALAESLRTPRAIYDYIVNGFEYNYDRVGPFTPRLGAVAALSNPDQAICMEFTDAFVAIARAAGIPAREINGFAYTQNPRLEPLGLVADVLHAWPEYWDNQRQAFIPVDPTWGNTTGGIDYFSKLDLRHISFVIHGTNSTEPHPAGSYKLGNEPQKDVFVSISSLPENRDEKIEVEIDRATPIALASAKYKAEIVNAGPVGVYNKEVDILFDGTRVDGVVVAALAPYGREKIEFRVPFGVLGAQAPENVAVRLDTQLAQVSTNKERGVMTHLAIVLFGILVTVGFAFMIVVLSRKRDKIYE